MYVGYLYNKFDLCFYQLFSGICYKWFSCCFGVEGFKCYLKVANIVRFNRFCYSKELSFNVNQSKVWYRYMCMFKIKYDIFLFWVFFFKVEVRIFYIDCYKIYVMLVFNELYYYFLDLIFFQVVFYL